MCLCVCVHVHSLCFNLQLQFPRCPNKLDGSASVLYGKGLPQSKQRRRFEIRTFQFLDLKSKKFLDEEVRRPYLNCLHAQTLKLHDSVLVWSVLPRSTSCATLKCAYPLRDLVMNVALVKVNVFLQFHLLSNVQ